MDWFPNVVDWLGDQLSYILSFIVVLLPDSPFQLLSYTPISNILPYINYFIPIDFILSTLTAWGTAITIYYAYQIVLKWAKAVS